MLFMCLLALNEKTETDMTSPPPTGRHYRELFWGGGCQTHGGMCALDTFMSRLSIHLEKMDNDAEGIEDPSNRL